MPAPTPFNHSTLSKPIPPSMLGISGTLPYLRQGRGLRDIMIRNLLGLTAMVEHPYFPFNPFIFNL